MIAESDCLLVVGCKLGEIATKRFTLIPPGKTVIHIELDPAEIGRTTRAEVALVSDARLALEDLSRGTWEGLRRLRLAAPTGAPRYQGAWRPGARRRATGCIRPSSRSTSAA